MSRLQMASAASPVSCVMMILALVFKGARLLSHLDSESVSHQRLGISTYCMIVCRWSRVSLLVQLNDPSKSNGYVAL